jgi:hypothetical protein
MSIHPTAITFHDCRIHLEPIGPGPGIPEQRYRFDVEHCASTEALLGTAIRQWVIGTKPPRKCQHCSGTIEGGGFVIVGGGVVHHECFREAMTSAKATKFITTAVVPSGTVEISANTEGARLQARLIIEGHKANLDRIAELKAQLAAEQRLRDEIAAAAGTPGGEATLPHVRRVVAERNEWRHEAEECRTGLAARAAEIDLLRASRQAMAEQSATYMRERDEARANLQKLVDRRIDGIPGPPWPTDLVAEVKRLRAAIQAVIDMPPVQCGEYSYLPFVNGQNLQQERIQGELRKALSDRPA